MRALHILLATVLLIACNPAEIAPVASGTNNEVQKGNEETGGETTPETKSTMYISVNSHKLTVDLVSNSSTAALLELLKSGNITYEAHDYGSFEKVGDIGHTLPQNNEQITTEPGDVILYLGSNICIYYDTNSWNFTRLGKIKDVSQSELKQILGTGDVTVTLSL